MNRRVVRFGTDYWHVVDDDDKEIVGFITLLQRETAEPWLARKERLGDEYEDWRSQYFATKQEALVWMGAPSNALDEEETR